MGYTRATLIQDQENKLRHLRNLRLNYFIHKRRIRGMDPITPYSEKFDL
jgi:predicted HicB family RNase H-like nuclease